jgi:hypothetical protein
MIIKAKSIIYRLYQIFSREMQLDKQMSFSKKYYKQTKSSAKIFLTSKNIFIEVMQFVDLDDLARFSLTCKKAKNELANDIIWKKHFDRTYTKFAVMTQSNSYFDRCKSAYINKKKLGSNLSQYERDWIMGWRVIAIEEFLSSICSMPHLLILPAKLLGYGLVPLKSKFIDWVNKLNLNSLFYTKFMEVSAGAPEWYPGYEEIIKQNANNFWRKHNVGIDAFFYFSKAMISYGSYYYTSIIYWFYYLFSGGEMHPVNKDPVRYYNGVRITRVLAYNPGYGIIQLISLPILVADDLSICFSSILPI